MKIRMFELVVPFHSDVRRLERTTGMPGDRRGSIIIGTSLARELLPRAGARGSDFSPGSVEQAMRGGIEPLELPVTSIPNEGEDPSSVPPLRDGCNRAIAAWQIRFTREERSP